MRGIGEIAYRLRQEVGNAWLYMIPPAEGITAQAPLAGLPEYEGVAEFIRGTDYERRLIEVADEVSAHRFPLLGVEVDTGPEIGWRKDYSTGVESSLRYFRLIPYMDTGKVGNQKLVWELNRHQHLPLLAQAWLATGEERYLDTAFRHLEDWWRQNPFQRGMNWTAALEVAFRALSWTWLYHLSGQRMKADTRRRFLRELGRHGHHLEWNLSVYYSPNTHLLGEAVALHALGALFPRFRRAEEWRRLGAEAAQGHMRTHVRADGSYFEQSSYYHLYALDFFLLHALLAPVPEEYRRKLEAMARFVAALQGSSRLLPFLGDDDGGRTFHPYGERRRFGRASLATAALLLGLEDLGDRAEDGYEQALWWLGRDKVEGRRSSSAWRAGPRRFADAGILIMTAGDVQVIVDAGPFGSGRAGHSHSDTLSILMRKGSEEVLVDAGTYSYQADPRARDWFRGTAAHNTIRVDGGEQAHAGGLFRWSGAPEVEITEWEANAGWGSYVNAAVRYGGFTHRRRVALLAREELLFVLDEAGGQAGGEHVVEQFWHWGEGRARLFSTHAEWMEEETGGEHGWRSTVFGKKARARVSRLTYRGAMPVVIGTVIDARGRDGEVEMGEQAGGWSIRFRSERRWEARFFREGAGIVEG